MGAAQIIHQLTFGMLEDPDIQRKKPQFSEGELLRTNVGTACGVFETFSNFQIIEKIMKIKNFSSMRNVGKLFGCRNFPDRKIFQLFMISVENITVYFP